MKKSVVLFTFAIALFSCSLDSGDNNGPIDTVLMSITSVDIPDEFIFGENYEITVNYLRPNGCYEFNNFIFQPDVNTRRVAVVDNVYDRECTLSVVEAAVSFEFRVLSNETYVFQFFQGASESGDDQYLIVEVPVIE